MPRRCHAVRAFVSLLVLPYAHTLGDFKRELAETNRKLSERKIIEKAKGVLMKTRGMDEDAAYKALRKLAMERSQPLASVATNLVDMAQLLL